MERKLINNAKNQAYPDFQKMKEEEIQNYLINFVKTRSGLLSGHLDLTQELFLKLWSHRFDYNPAKGAFSTYAFNWTRKVIQESVKRKSDDIKKIEIVKRRNANKKDHVSVYENNELFSLIKKNVSDLEFQILKLRFEDEFTIKQIGDKVGKPSEYVVKTLEKLKKRLRVQLRDWKFPNGN